MKISAGKADSFIGKPDPQITAVLLYGPDQGLVRERVLTLSRNITGSLDDPFALVSVKTGALRKEPSLLADEKAAISFGGGRRVIRVDDATDAVVPALELALAGSGDGLIILQAGELGPRSKLRKCCETSKSAASIGCYADTDRSLQQVIRETLESHGLNISRDAVSYLSAHLGADRGVSRSELEKLALFMGEKKTVDLEDAQACVGDNAGLTLDTLVYATVTGDRASFDRAFQRAMTEGAQPITILRAALRTFQRLHLVHGDVRRGRSPEQAVDSLRPPLIFKDKPLFLMAVRIWSPDRIEAAFDALTEAENHCKTTALPAEAICHRHLLRFCATAGRQRR